MLGQILTIARNTFVESIRQPIFFVLIMAGGLAQVFNTLLSAYSMGYTEQTEVYGDNKLLLDMGLATVLVVGTLLAAFIATSVLSKEIENKTALTVISKPVGRPLFVVGKFLGVAGAILVAMVILLVFLLFAIRHEVMSTARDRVDGPVVLFASLSVLIPIFLAIWGNYFYGWVFSSTATVFMLPLTVLAYVITLTVSEEWAFQPITTDLKPQILIASGCVCMSMLVLTAVAIAASTRLGQVMTIVVSAGAFVLGLLSNYLVGRHAFDNDPVGVVESVSWPDERPNDLRSPGDEVYLRLKSPPDADMPPGTSIYYGPTPLGLALAVPAHRAFEGDPGVSDDIFEPATGPALIVTERPTDMEVHLMNVGGLRVERPPAENDHLFLRPTTIRPLPFAIWSLVPNMQTYWLVDAITQGHPIPVRYVGLAGAYTVVQVTGLLCVSIILFQRRDVG